MKSLGALILLGAANYATADYQDLRAGGHVNYGVFNGQTRKLIKDSDGNLKVENFASGDNLRVVCERASDRVKIWEHIADDIKAFQAQMPVKTIDDPEGAGGQPNADAFSTDSILVYACKLEKETTSGVWNAQPINSATNNDVPNQWENGTVTSSVAIQGSYVRVHYKGDCEEPISKTTFTSQIPEGTESYGGGAIYTAPLTLQATTPCIQPMGFQKKIEFDLQYDPTEEAKTAGIVSGAVTTGEVYFTKANRDLTGDGKTYTMTQHEIHFDLGADKPHPDYYESGVENCGSTGDEDLCKGGLKATLILDTDVEKTHSVATALVDYQTQGTGFKFKPCFHKAGAALAGTKEYDYLEACYDERVRDKVKAWTSAQNSAKYALQDEVAALVLEPRDSSDSGGPGSLLTDMICPFTCKDRNSASCPLTEDNTADSTKKSTLECLSIGVKHTVKLDDGNNVLHTPNFWDNRCAARTDGLSNPSAGLTAVLVGTEADKLLRDPYNFTHKFTRGGGNQKQFVNPANVTFLTYDVPLHSDVIRHDVNMTLESGTFATLNNEAAFFTVEGDGFVQEVSLNTKTLIIENVPTYVGSLTLYGQVFKTCSRVKVALSFPMTIEVTRPLLTSGVFRPVGFNPNNLAAHNPCNPLFEYVRTTNADNTPGAGQGMDYTVSGVLRGASLEEDPSLVKMCDEDPNVATGTSCARGAFHSSQVKPVSDNKGWGTPVALLEGLCTVDGFPRNAGVIGALVAFSDQRAYAPVICPGTCEESTIHDVSLDWDIELTVSTSDNPVDEPTAKSDHNKLIVRQETSNWDDTDVDTATPANRYYDLERVAYLIPATSDDCQADGTLSIDDDSIPTNSVAKHATDSPGCLVYKQTRPGLAESPWQTAIEYSGIVKAKDMVDWFKACGSQTALGAEVNLVQRFKVSYGDKRDISFCQTKKLSVTVQEVMVGESTHTLTTVQQENSRDSASIEAVLNQVQYTDDGCDVSGTYRLQAVTDVTTTVDVTADYSESPNWFQSGNTKWVAPVEPSNKGQFIWSTECVALCGSAQSLLTNFSAANTLVVALTEVDGGSGAQLGIQFTIDMEGSPCDDSSEVNKATAELTLYNAGPAVSNPGINHCETAFTGPNATANPRALTDMVCGRLSVTNLGDSKLFIKRTKLTRQLPDTAAELLCEANIDEEDAANGEPCVGDVRNVMFTSSDTESFTETVEDTGSFIHFANSPIRLVADDAFATLRYTIFWEQQLGGRRRLLRSDMILGAGESTIAGDLVVLPISDQIEDTVESLEEGGQAASTDAADTTDDKDSGLGAGAIVGIVGASLAVVVGVGYFVVQAGGVDLPSLFTPKKRPKKDGYSVVRRSERFSTLNF